MKQKILGILKRELQIVQSGYMNGNADLDGMEDAAEAIAQEVCNKCLRVLWFTHPHDKILAGGATGLLHSEGFTMDQIAIALNQFKQKEG